jgi:hypothetical protein
VPSSAGPGILFVAKPTRSAADPRIHYTAGYDLSAADHLSTIAEVGVALAGFAALVGVVGRRADGESSSEVGLRLLFGLETSLSLVAAALLPLVPLTLGFDDATVWRTSAAVWLAADLALSWWIVRRARSIGVPAVLVPVLSRAIWSASTLAQILLVGTILAVLPGRLDALYFGALYLNTLTSSLAFLAVGWQTFVLDAATE